MAGESLQSVPRSFSSLPRSSLQSRRGAGGMARQCESFMRAMDTTVTLPNDPLCCATQVRAYAKKGKGEKNAAKKKKKGEGVTGKYVCEMKNVTKEHVGHKLLFEDLNLSMFYGAKIGIIGINGSGPPLPPHSPALSHTLSHTALSHAHSRTYLSYTFLTRALSHSFTHSLSHSLTLSHTLTFTLSHTHSLTLAFSPSLFTHSLSTSLILTPITSHSLITPCSS